MAHELCLAFRTPRSSRRHQIQRRCSRCDIPQTASLQQVLGGAHRSRRISQHPSQENNSKSHRPSQSSSCANAASSAVSVVPVVTHKHGNNSRCGDHRRAHSASGPIRAPSSPYCVVRHRVDADVIEFHENGKLLDHHETATTLSSLSRCSTTDKLTSSCAFGLPSMH